MAENLMARGLLSGLFVITLLAFSGPAYAWTESDDDTGFYYAQEEGLEEADKFQYGASDSSESDFRSFFDFRMDDRQAISLGVTSREEEPYLQQEPASIYLFRYRKKF